MDGKWKQWMSNEKSKKIVLMIAGIVMALVIAGVCGFFYWLGLSHGKNVGDRQDAKVSGTQGNGKEMEEASGDSVAVSGEAIDGGTVSGQAVSADGVVVSGAGTDVNNGSGDGADNQNQSNSSINSNKGSNSSKNGNQNNSHSGNHIAGNGIGNGSLSASGNGGMAATATAGYVGKLSVSGNKLMANGSPIQLRGVSTHGLSWFPEYVNPTMFGEVKSWGANTVRLAMYTAEYNGYCTGDSGNRTKLKELVKKGVQYATEQGMYVIIDWHILSDGNPNTYKSEAIAFFTEMAQLYKDNNHVIYEICNEPNGGTSWSDVKSYAQDVIGAIRQYDPDGVILVGTPTWSQELDKAVADPITGYSNIMYTLHFYANTHRESLRNTLTQAVNAGLPVFVSEFSICDASGNGGINTEQANLWIQTLNQYGVSYVAWSLCNKAETSALIQSSCSKTNGITEGELSECGKWLLQTLQGKISLQNQSSSQNNSTNNQNQSSGQNHSTSQNNSGSNPETANSNSNTSSGNSNTSSSSSNGQSGTQQSVKKPEQYTPQCSGGAQVTVVNSWQEGNAFCIQYDVKVANTTGSQKDGWTGTLTFPANATVVSGWNANFTANGNRVIFTNMDYNKTIPAGGKAEGIGCIIKFN